MNNTNVFVTHLIKSQHFPYLFYFFSHKWNETVDVPCISLSTLPRNNVIMSLILNTCSEFLYNFINK